MSPAHTTDLWAISTWLLQATKFWDGLLCSYLNWNHVQNEGPDSLLRTCLLFSLSTLINTKCILSLTWAKLLSTSLSPFLSSTSSCQSEYCIILTSIKSQNLTIFHYSHSHQGIIFNMDYGNSLFGIFTVLIAPIIYPSPHPSLPHMDL